MYLLRVILIILLLAPSLLFAQDLEGVVYESGEQNKKEPLTGVNIYWLETSEGVVTGFDGYFEIHRHSDVEKNLVISFIGYQNDTIFVESNQQFVEVILSSKRELSEVVISEKMPSQFISKLKTIQTEKITGAELRKAACCNLSESFETNPSVDVSYSDAVTGAKQIQLLGLAGIYSQMLAENIPIMRGLANAYGLEYIPGSWMESIHVSKGTSSVTNGFESVTGQINVEFKKPDNSDKFYFNAYGNDKGKFEFNTDAAVKINDKWSTMVFGHYENFNVKHDMNNDGFIDKPLVTQYNFMNRWKYLGNSPVRFQFGINVLNETRTGGQVSYDPKSSQEQADVYGILMETDQYRAFGKIGYLFNRKNTSMGFINNFTYHSLDGNYGMRSYTGKQTSWYSNLIFQSYISTIDHGYKVGFSFMYDDYEEGINDSIFNSTEVVSGIFGEYSYIIPDKLTILAGIRADYHNAYGLFFTPRVHAKYHPDDHTTIRISAGKGYRTAKIIAENNYLLASSRVIVVKEDLKQENAWNTGINLVRDIHVMGKELTVSMDYYYTHFRNQIIIDQDQDIQKIVFYNLDGKSFSNSFQAQVSYELIERFDVSMAYRLNYVKTTINDVFTWKPLVNKHKGLLTLSYKTNFEKWQFDYILQYNGKSRIPDTDQYPVEYRRAAESPDFVIMNLQVKKNFRKWQLYLGAENLTDFVQKNPIIAADDPFGDYFDATMVWGPIMGRKVYAGIKVYIK